MMESSIAWVACVSKVRCTAAPTEYSMKRGFGGGGGATHLGFESQRTCSKTWTLARIDV